MVSDRKDDWVCREQQINTAIDELKQVSMPGCIKVEGKLTLMYSVIAISMGSVKRTIKGRARTCSIRSAKDFSSLSRGA